MFGIDDLALATVGSALIGGAGSFFGAKSQNEASAKLAAENREWQERMSNTAHQREVDDLRAAGLNPILSATGGKGASTPSGNVAPVVNKYEGAAKEAGASLDRLFALRQLNATTAKTEADTNLVNTTRWLTETNALKANTELNFMAQYLQGRNAQQALDIAGSELSNKLRELSMSTAQAESTLGLIDDEFYRSIIGKLARQGQLGAQAIHPIVRTSRAMADPPVREYRRVD